MIRRVLGLAALLVAVPTLALAEDIGAKGYITSLEVNTQSADQYLMYHGRLVVNTGKAFTEYRWGGTSCGTRVITDAQLALLLQVADSGLRITPRYQLGQGDSQCLVGFRITQ